jgi:Phytanoyl-CoA dioxygenase (PhyH)
VIENILLINFFNNFGSSFDIFGFFQGGVNKFYHGIRGFEDEPLLLLPMNPGDTVFFHPLLIHGSGANVTEVTNLLTRI